jgi:hypothetical protein
VAPGSGMVDRSNRGRGRPISSRILMDATTFSNDTTGPQGTGRVRLEHSGRTSNRSTPISRPSRQDRPPYCFFTDTFMTAFGLGT